MLRAVTFDYWDTLYHGASRPERVTRRREALLHLAREHGASVAPQEFHALYRDSAIEFEQVWRSGRGYRTEDRIQWILDRVGLGRPVPPERLAKAAGAVDDSLVDVPPSMLPGAAHAIERLGERYQLAIISDTGFASGRAQDRVLEQDGLRHRFIATIYSMDIGRAKPSPLMFQAALAALGVAPAEALHVGDIERTDIGGALGAGMRAIRLDAVREGGPSHAERVVNSLTALADLLDRETA